MNRKSVLGISFAAAFAVTMIFAQSASAGGGDYTTLSLPVSVSGAGFLSTEITTGGTIPLDGSQGAFGYGILTDGTNFNNVLALTTHVCAADHFSQSQIKDGSCGHTVGLLNALGLGQDARHNGPEMHAHVLDLKLVDSESACFGISSGALAAEVDLQKTLDMQNNVIAMYTIEIDDNVIRTSAPISDLADGDLDAIAYFGIQPVATKNGSITNLCLTDLAVVTAP
jgi:hypothetical protein